MCLLARLIQSIPSPQALWVVFSRVHEIYKFQGWQGVWQGVLRERKARLADDKSGAAATRSYQEWIARDEGKLLINKRVEGDTCHQLSPLISIIMATNGQPSDQLMESMKSVIEQENRQWELLVIGAPSDVGVGGVAGLDGVLPQAGSRIKFLNLNGSQSLSELIGAALNTMSGEYFFCLKPGDVLSKQALQEVARQIIEKPGTLIFYSDEDQIDSSGQRHAPCFKSDLNPVLLSERAYFGCLTVCRTSYARNLGRQAAETWLSYQWRLALHTLDENPEEKIVHIKAILCHRRTRAAQQKRECSAPLHNLIPEPAPLVSLIIPTKNNAALLRRCLDSIDAKTEYGNYELIIVDNQSDDSETLAYLKGLATRPKFKILRYDAPFNYSAINNFAVRQANGELLCFLNNDVEVISRGWLSEMAGLALRSETGAVGAMLYFSDDTIQHAGIVLGLGACGAGGIVKNVFCGLPRGFSGQGGRLKFRQNVSAVTGACMILRRSVFEAVGGFDEVNLPVAFNDVDLCLRITDKGFRNVLTPCAELYHYESSSRGDDNTAAKRARFSNEVLYMRRRWGVRLGYDPFFPSGELSTCDWR